MSERPEARKPKPLLPTTKPVLKQSQGSSDKQSLPPLPFSSSSRIKPLGGAATQGSATPLSIPNPFLKGGKFASTALKTDDFDDKGDDDEVETSVSPTKSSSVWRSPARSTVHSKPKFKQFIPKPVEESKVDKQKQSLKDLINDDYSQEETEEGKSNAKPLHVDGLAVQLLGHQCVGVRFMAGREKARKYGRGGLLADDMGLGKTIQSIALILHNKQTVSGAPKTTLVVCPLAVMEQWKEEIMKMAPKLKVATHQGPKRVTNADLLMTQDVIITTYDTVSSESRNAGFGSPLFDCTFYRIIADEAHTFRNPTTQMSKAMMKLETINNERKWVLTGTPVHNDVRDILTLLTFANCSLDGQPLFSVNNKVTNSDSAPLKHLLQKVMLRRTQKVIAKVLPELDKEQRSVKLTDNERMVYDKFLDSSMDFLPKLVRLRQACDGLDVFNLLKKSVPEESTVEEIPMDSKTSKNSSDFATNETDMLAGLLDSLSLQNKKEETYFGHDNSKIQLLREVLCEDRIRQTVVFSSFVTMLRAIEPMLKHEGINYAIYDGSLRATERSTILHNFRDPKSGITVLLCSLQTAAVGLNLTSASQVIMIDPWWNPQIVDQAIKRVHRLGQSRRVRCIELFAKNAVDERMLHIQNEKRKLASNLLSDSDHLTSHDTHYLLYGDTTDDDTSKPTNTPPKKDNSRPKVKEEKPDTTKVEPPSWMSPSYTSPNGKLPRIRKLKPEDAKDSSEKDSSEKHKHKSDKHKSDKHKSDKHKSDKHKSEKHKSDKHKSDKHKSENWL